MNYSKQIGIIRSLLLCSYLGTKRWCSNSFPSSLTPLGTSSMCMMLFSSSDTSMDELHTAGILNTNTTISMCLHKTRRTRKRFSSDRTVHENGMAAFPLPFSARVHIFVASILMRPCQHSWGDRRGLLVLSAKKRVIKWQLIQATCIFVSECGWKKQWRVLLQLS